MKRAFVYLVLIASLSGCAKFMSNLRRDLDDGQQYAGPTVGGTWSERGILEEDPYLVGHQDRSPSSMRAANPGGGSWIAPEQNDSNQRDRYRNAGEGEEGAGPVTYSGNPMMPPASKQLYKNGIRATRSDFEDDGKNHGSLWGSDGQTNYYFTKNKIRTVGDIVSIKVETDLKRDTVTEVARTLSPREREAELELAQTRIRNRALGIVDKVDSSSAAPERAPAEAPVAGPVAGKEIDEDSIPQATYADIDVAKSLEFNEGDTVMAEIVERFPNGNYKVRGVKRMRYRNGFRFMKLTAVVRGADISEDEIINSGKLYEYRLEVIR